MFDFFIAHSEHHILRYIPQQKKSSLKIKYDDDYPGDYSMRGIRFVYWISHTPYRVVVC